MVEDFDSVLDRLRPGMTVFVPGMSGESQAFFEALQARPDATAGVRFVGVHFPGINTNDYLALDPTTKLRAYFMTPSLRRGLAESRAELVHLDHPRIYRDLADCGDIDMAVAQVAPPDANGLCSPGPCCDFLPAVWAQARYKVLHINPALAATRGSFAIRCPEADAVVQAPAPVIGLPTAEPDPLQRACAESIVKLVRDGDTIEFGIGKMPAAVLEALAGHRDLKVWSGMVSPPVTRLIDQGAVAGAGAVQTGVALGDEAFYRRVAEDDTFYFRSVADTHDVRRLASIDRFCAINSAVSVDLFGQVNADSLNGKQVAGVGGLPAFVNGALLAEGGRSIICLPSTNTRGDISRLVPRLAEGELCGLPRHAADYVVTEHGVAALRGLGIDARARALIEIAAPEFRDSLTDRWRALAAGL